MSIRDLIAILPEPLRHRSLTHPSVADPYESNGRLEFLGDSVLNSRVAELVFHGYPELLEGDLTRIRAHLVRKSFLASVGRSRGARGDHRELRHKRLGHRGHRRGHNRRRVSHRQRTRLQDVDEIFNPSEVDTDELRDWKTLLQETLQADGLRPDLPGPLQAGPGPPPAASSSAVSVDGSEVATGEGTSIKESEQTAARAALEILGIRPVARARRRGPRRRVASGSARNCFQR